MNELANLSVFSGIGMIDLASEWAGFKIVGQVEKAEYPFNVLCKHWPNVPKWRDIKDVTVESIRKQGINNITLLSGGFPCQDTSLAGKYVGISGCKSGLVYEMLRLLKDLQPSYALFENVSGFRTNGLKEVLEKIAEIGYDAEWYTLRASGFGAPHKRERTFILAHTKRYQQQSPEPCNWEVGRMGRIIKPIPWNITCEDALCNLRGMDDGNSYGVDRIDTIRNSVVPLQVYPLLKAIADTEREIKCT